MHYTEEEREYFKKQITALYPEMYRFIKAQLHPLNHGVAEDILQTACRKAWESFYQLRDRKSFHNWIYRILINTRNEYYRRVIDENEFMFFSEDPESEARDRNVSTYLHDELTVQKDVLDALIEEEDSRRLLEAFDQLDDQDKQLLKLWLIGGCTEKELAEKSGINYNTLRSRIHRGMIRLKKKYDELERRDEDE